MFLNPIGVNSFLLMIVSRNSDQLKLCPKTHRPSVNQLDGLSYGMILT